MRSADHTAQADGDDAEITAPEPVMLGFAIACLVGMLAIHLLARPGVPSSPAIAAFGVASLACFLLSVIPRDPVMRPALTVVAIACSIPIAYVVGPSSMFGGVLAIILLLTGML